MDPTNPSQLATALAALLPVVLGGTATYLNIFLGPKDEIRSRVSLRKRDLLEKVATQLSMLLNHARKIGDDNLLRGDGRNEPDLVGNYTEELFRLFTISYRLETLKSLARLCYIRAQE